MADENASHTMRHRVANACDGCKARKVKCDGRTPCGHCVRRRRPQACHYSPQRRRARIDSRKPETEAADADAADANVTGPASNAKIADASGVDLVSGRRLQSASVSASAAASAGAGNPMSPPPPPSLHSSRDARAPSPAAAAASHVDVSAEDDTDVPREARLLCDSHGKLIFIGDCAPLSFFQSVRQLVTAKVGLDAFAPQTSRFSVLENAAVATGSCLCEPRHGLPEVKSLDLHAAVATYLSATSGLVDLLDDSKLLDDLLLWANHHQKPDDAVSIVNFLVLAIGCLMIDEDIARAYFEHARERAYARLSTDLSVGTIQAFTLITVYMLCSCQINGAFLYFGIAVRAAYSIGLHRTEVNARFGADTHRRRDRLWKSLRVVDLFLSTSMGRPPATSDVDCTVSYRSVDAEGQDSFDLLSASVQILLVVESIVVEVYSKRKVSLQRTEGISRQLREWSARWLRPLKDVVSFSYSEVAHASGACQVLTTYYYAVMLVSRPFLMYELVRRLSEGQLAIATRTTLASDKTKHADACIEAASLMIDLVLELVDRGCLNGRRPLLVSWLFSASLVLGVGLLGGFGRVLEKYTKMSIRAQDHFAQSDTHARQYSLIAQSLLTAALAHLERQELQDRRRRTESSSQLFGLVPYEPRDARTENALHYRPGDLGRHTKMPSAAAPSPSAASSRRQESAERSFLQHQGLHDMESPRIGSFDSSFWGLGDPLAQAHEATAYFDGGRSNEGNPGSALNLFPLLDEGGGIDLAHYL